MAWKNKLNNHIAVAETVLDSMTRGIQLPRFLELSVQLIESSKDVAAELSLVDWKTFEGEDREIVECLTYRWSVDALDVSILLRDAYLRSSKNYILFLSKGGSSEDPLDVNPEIINTCHQAISQNLQLVNEILAHESGPNQEWLHQLSPVPVILDQKTELLSQFSSISDSHQKLIKVVPRLNRYREYLMDYSNDRLIQLRSLQSNVESALEVIEKIPGEVKRDDVVSASKSLQSISESIENAKITAEVFEHFHCGYSNLKVPIHADGGELSYKEFSIDKKVESWTENQLFPKLYDADLDINSLYDSTLIHLFNTRNKLENLALNEQENYDIEREQLNGKLLDQKDTITEYSSHLDAEVSLVNSMVSEELLAEKIYDMNSMFLPELNFTNITKIANQRLWYQSNVWGNWKNRLGKLISDRKIPFITSMQQDPYDFIESRIIEDHDLDSNSLFLKKGYLGRSFYIQRKEEQVTITRAIKRWQNGYQGSVLMVGRRGSGKSSLMEFLPQIVDQFPVVQMSIHSIMKVNGRKHQVSHKIQDSINFLSANSINKPIIVCIDDLEKWQYGSQTMYETIKEVTDGISRCGKRLFFVISTNHFMHNYINRWFDFNSRFAETLNMDGMHSQSIVDALVLRHNASLKNLELEENVNIAKRAAKIVANSRNNIGSSMLAWERYLEHGVKMGMPSLSFSKLVNSHHLILRIILTHGNLKENSLRKALTNSDNNFLSEQVRKLIGYKIVERTFDGYLRVNPFIIDEVEYVLLRKTN